MSEDALCWQKRAAVAAHSRTAAAFAERFSQLNILQHASWLRREGVLRMMTMGELAACATAAARPGPA